MPKPLISAVVLSSLLLAGTTAFAADLQINPSSGAPVGTTITVTLSGEASPDARYRFAVMRVGGSVRIIYDYQRSNTFAWTPDQDGLYVVEGDFLALMDSDLWFERT